MLYQKRTLLRLAPALAVFELVQLLGAARKGWLIHWLRAAGSLARRAVPPDCEGCVHRYWFGEGEPPAGFRIEWTPCFSPDAPEE